MVPVENLVPRTSLHTVEHAFLVPGQNAGIDTLLYQSESA